MSKQNRSTVDLGLHTTRSGNSGQLLVIVANDFVHHCAHENDSKIASCNIWHDGKIKDKLLLRCADDL